MATTSESQVRQNFHQECEEGINRQINMELYACYVYLSMSYYFDRDDVALSGFANYFRRSSQEEIGHAEKLMKYMNKRGGRIILQDIKRPDRDEWGSGVDALQAALDLEKEVNDALLKLHQVAAKHHDAEMCNFLEGEYLAEQVDAIKQISDLITNLKRAGPGLGEYIFDKDTMEKEDEQNAADNSPERNKVEKK